MENEWFQISLKLNWFSAEFHILVCIIQNRRSDHFIYRQKELPNLFLSIITNLLLKIRWMRLQKITCNILSLGEKKKIIRRKYEWQMKHSLHLW